MHITSSVVVVALLSASAESVQQRQHRNTSIRRSGAGNSRHLMRQGSSRRNKENGGANPVRTGSFRNKEHRVS